MKLCQILLFGIFLSCEKKKSDVLIQANNLHIEAISMQAKLEKRLVELKIHAVKQNDSLLLSKIDSVANLVHLWEVSLLEIPGFTHDHHTHIDVQHEHKPVAKMTDESMLEYQLNAKSAMEELSREVNSWKIEINPTEP